MKHNILLIDDDQAVRDSMTAFLTDEGFYAKAVSSGSEGIALVKQKTIPFSLALIDYHMPDINGIEAIKQIRKYNPDLALLAFSGDDSVAAHNESLDSGAIFFIPKEMADEKLLGVIHRICKDVEKRIKPLAIIDESANSKLIQSVGMVGISSAMAKVANYILKFGPSSESVFIRGENGTGKEKVARAIHQNSPRYLQPFIDINCGAISESLIESELFGHVKGSFSGATNDKVGKFQAANGGTIFLDEIGEMPYHLQVKLLRVLQEKAITPVGSNITKKIDVRIITATNAPIEEMIAQKLFREDLYYRIKVLPITLPPLRERPEDIPLLTALFLREANKDNGTSKIILESSVEELKKLKWPGNVRELQHTISFLVSSTEGNTLDLSLLSEECKIKKYSTRKPKDYDSFKFRNIAEEKTLIEEALRVSKNITVTAAKKLGMKRSTLRDKIKKYGIIFEEISELKSLEEV